MKANLELVEGMTFKCQNNELITYTQAPDADGQKTAPSPKELLLNAMMSCTAMDAISILRKMRQDVKTFQVSIDAQKNTDHPIHFKSALISFIFTGELSAEKALKAATSSLTKYCGVNYMVSKVCDLTFNVSVNGELSQTYAVEFIEPEN